MMDVHEIEESIKDLEDIAKLECISGLYDRMDRAYTNYCSAHLSFNHTRAMEYSLSQGIEYIQRQMMFREEAMLNDNYHGRGLIW
jgi:hypothetical protein